jgi:hypothetical protein
MKRVEISILVWGIYIILIGLCLITIPAIIMAFFGYQITDDLWVRFTGILSVVLGLYYIQVAFKKIVLLYRWKIVGHVFGLTCMTAFLLTGLADQRLIGTMVVEVAGCLWTLIALKLDSPSMAPVHMR